MRVLYVTPILPSIAGGFPTRIYNLIKHQNRHHSISVLSFLQPFEQPMVADLAAICQNMELIPLTMPAPLGKWQNRLRGWTNLLISPEPQLVRTFPIARLGEPLRRLTAAHHFDIVVFEGLSTAPLRPVVANGPAVLTEHNVEYVILERQRTTAKSPVHRLRDLLEVRKLRRFEAASVRRFNGCIAVSEQDALTIKRLRRTDLGTYVVPNGVDCDYFAPTPYPDTPKTCDLVFVGTMHYQPNVDAVTFFCRNVLPLIRRDLPEIRLTIVGSRPVAEVLELASLPGVNVTGSVPDVRPYYWHSKLSIVPLRIGGGTRLKILESLAAGCAVLSTSIGAEGLNLQHGTHLLLADTPELFADSVVRLLIDPSLRRKLARQGQMQVCQEYGWPGIVSHLDAAYEELVDEHHRTQG